MEGSLQGTVGDGVNLSCLFFQGVTLNKILKGCQHSAEPSSRHGKQKNKARKQQLGSGPRVRAQG